jgi:predicted amidophosphoribosyltransferase
MPTVRELSGLYENFLISPRSGCGVCTTCFNLTLGYTRCYACTQRQSVLDVVAPISYSVAGEQLHHALASYKRLEGEVARRLRAELASVLWRYLAKHERCVARAADTAGFELVTTVPSSDRDRDEHHPLHRMVGDLVGPARERYDRLLRRSNHNGSAREFDPRKYTATRSLDGGSVLLIDDTWTTGANAQSAAAALKQAGAGMVGAIVIGRHLNREWRENDRRLRGIARPFDWSRCARCAEP